MGNQNASGEVNLDTYVKNSGLSQGEVQGIWNVFESLEPKNGVIQTGTVQRLYRDSYDAPQLNVQIGGRESLTFDEFFELMRANMIKKKQEFPGVEFDDGQNENVQCFFCQPSRQ